MSDVTMIRVYPRDVARLKTYGKIGESYAVVFSRILDDLENYNNQKCVDESNVA
ncbi:MAG TPA: hypothetical protein VN455_05630 [Methanotrichaceae archaeon]|nr:hypothetical protein [Methanotrichaceae archaeon]